MTSEPKTCDKSNQTAVKLFQPLSLLEMQMERSPDIFNDNTLTVDI